MQPLRLHWCAVWLNQGVTLVHASHIVLIAHYDLRTANVHLLSLSVVTKAAA